MRCALHGGVTGGPDLAGKAHALSTPRAPGTQRLAIVSPDTGNNTVEGGSGDQPLFTKARPGAAAAQPCGRCTFSRSVLTRARGGAQDASLAWVVNGEIYNHTALKARRRAAAARAPPKPNPAAPPRAFR